MNWHWLTDTTLAFFVTLHKSLCFWLFIQADEMWYFCYLCVSDFGLHFVALLVAVGTTTWWVADCVVKFPFRYGLYFILAHSFILIFLYIIVCYCFTASLLIKWDVIKLINCHPANCERSSNGSSLPRHHSSLITMISSLDTRLVTRREEFVSRQFIVLSYTTRHSSCRDKLVVRYDKMRWSK